MVQLIVYTVDKKSCLLLQLKNYSPRKPAKSTPHKRNPPANLASWVDTAKRYARDVARFGLTPTEWRGGKVYRFMSRWNKKYAVLHVPHAPGPGGRVRFENVGVRLFCYPMAGKEHGAVWKKGFRLDVETEECVEVQM